MTGSRTYVWFRFLTDNEVASYYRSDNWTGATLNFVNVQSAKETFKFKKPMELNATINARFKNSNHLDNVCITSPM